MENCGRSPRIGADRLASVPSGCYKEPESVCPLGGRRQMERCKDSKSPTLPASFFAVTQSRGSLCYSIVFHQPALFSLHTASAPETKYIYHLAVCCIRAPLAGWVSITGQNARDHTGGLGRGSEERGERKEENKIRVSNSVCQPVGVARLMTTKGSAALINTHLS